MSELKKRIREVRKTWDKLPKATNDDGVFVIIAEKDQGEGYEEYKECLGVNKEGELIWCFLSGCSCDGFNENKKVTDVTSKVFAIEADKTAEEFYTQNKIEPTETSYQSY